MEQTRPGVRPSITPAPAPAPRRQNDAWSVRNESEGEELTHLPRPAYGNMNDADLDVGYWARRAKACQ
ncbi:hypothetical protein N7471_001033 [Penicillium samsonianum]|uniref:uncharacterized protein n=1 Tax=Penicillium samsonianum TaxID=1882272 RepID=UPI00254769BE|nr:uncharacterized protein N7471_001033 [Penicillium samsonianum]KAJ6149834.1 hypothetical protein N7471_001033 [Penicillium samsonianum]